MLSKFQPNCSELIFSFNTGDIEILKQYLEMLYDYGYLVFLRREDNDKILSKKELNKINNNSCLYLQSPSGLLLGICYCEDQEYTQNKAYYLIDGEYETGLYEMYKELLNLIKNGCVSSYDGGKIQPFEDFLKSKLSYQEWVGGYYPE